jgi:putative heme-binding domain-containing protein
MRTRDTRFTLSALLVVTVSLFSASQRPAHAQPKNLPPNLVAPTDALSPEEERKQFTVPEGFEVQLVASEPDIQKPMQMAFDAKGRLWVTTSYHYPFAAEKGKATDKLFVLSDFDPKTGKARKVQKFAEDLNIPIGILPMPDCKSCIVSSIGEIRKYTDTDGDGKADKHEVLFTGFGSRDTHGMYNSYTLMPDGWVYACHGFANESTVKGKDGHEVKMHSGHTFRFKPDGSRIEVWSRGQVNPFGMTVDPFFNLYTADCHSKPITQIVPGAYYESFGKPHDGLGFTPHVTRHDHGSTGLCGLAWYDADHFPKDYLGTMFLGNVVTNRINFDKIEWKGSTPVAVEQPDFLVSKDRWFRPVDIKLGADGVIYVADFYNKIIGHYEVDLKHPGRDKDRGRIWRIVWKGKDGKAPAPKLHRDDFTKATEGQLLDDLFHPNITVRFLAGHQLRERTLAGQLPTSEAILDKMTQNKDRASSVIGWLAFLTESSSNPVRVNDYGAIVNFAKDPKNIKPEQLTGHLVRAITMRKDWKADERKIILDILESLNSPHITRAAVEGIAAHPHANFVEPLVKLLQECPAEDVLLKQAAKIALRNCLGTVPKDFINGTAVTEKTAAIYAESLLGLRSELGASFLARIPHPLPPAFAIPAAELIGHYGQVRARIDWFEQNVGKADLTTARADTILAFFRGLQAGGRKLETFELKQLADLLLAEMKDKGTPLTQNRDFPATSAVAVANCVRVVQALPAVSNSDSLTTYRNAFRDAAAVFFTAKDCPSDLRASNGDLFLLFLPNSETEYARFGAVLKSKDTPEALRERLLAVAASSRVPAAQMDARDAMQAVPYRVAVQIGLSLAGTKDGAELLLTAVKQGKAPARLLQEKAVLERLKASNAPNWEKQVADLTKALPALDQRLADLIKKRTTGFASAKADKAEGAKLFTKHCAACHKIGDVGGKIAPQLDGIGVRGLERLLEDTLDPNRNVDQAFRARAITLTNEKTLTALMLRVEGEVLVVADLEGKEQRIPLKEIAVNRETQLSAMPANFADVIPESDFYHILAYLLDQKTKDPPKK